MVTKLKFTRKKRAGPDYLGQHEVGVVIEALDFLQITAKSARAASLTKPVALPNRVVVISALQPAN
jgi:hypothetical protein